MMYDLGHPLGDADFMVAKGVLDKNKDGKLQYDVSSPPPPPPPPASSSSYLPSPCTRPQNLPCLAYFLFFLRPFPRSYWFSLATLF